MDGYERQSLRCVEARKIGMFILLAMVVLIGSFSIVTTLVMLVMERRTTSPS